MCYRFDGPGKQKSVGLDDSRTTRRYPMAMDNSQFIDDVPSYKPPLSSEISHLPSDFPVIFQ